MAPERDDGFPWEVAPYTGRVGGLRRQENNGQIAI